MSGAEGAPAVGAVTLHRSASAAARLAAAHRFVEGLPPASEALVVGAARNAVDDFVRESAARRGAAFGLHRFSLRRLATRLAAPRLAARGLAPATRLGAEAVAARAAFEALDDLDYLAPIARSRSFGRTLASTLEEVRGAGVEADAVSARGAVGADLDALSSGYARQLEAARLVDLPELYRLATAVITAGEPVDVPLDVPVVLLDVPIHDRAARDLVVALGGRATRLLATVPRGDDRTWAALARLPRAEAAPPDDAAGSGAELAPPGDAAGAELALVRNRLFEPIAAPGPEGAGSIGAGVLPGSAPGESRQGDAGARVSLPDPRSVDSDDAGSRREDTGADVSLAPAPEDEAVAPREPDDAESAGPEVSLFSAPGESRECVEIARLVHKEAAAGVRFDRMAVVLRSPAVYGPLLETALRRAGVEAWFVRGTRAPDPAGRAFLALLACAAEQLSARRFSEYLSLGQVPEPDAEGAPPADRARWVPPAEADETLPAPALPVQGSLFDAADLDPGHDDPGPGAPPDADDRPVVDGTLRAPWRWDRLLVESAVIGGRDRWARRLDGLEQELRLQIAECAGDDPESPRARRLERDVANLGHLRRFALPVIERLDALPGEAPWGDWLDALDALAPMVLRGPDEVLKTLGQLRPLAGVGPVSLTEVRDVLAERLTELPVDPPARRYGRVFVGGPEHVRGRVFDVIFVPGLAERMFPQKPRQDPILLDEVRRRLNAPDAGPAEPDDRGPDGSLSVSPTPPEPAPRQGAQAGPGDGGPDSPPAIPPPRPAPAPHRGADPDPLGLPVLDDRAAGERLLLRLAVGAAVRRLHLSYSRLELRESRPRVPSFYALDLERARTGRVPDFKNTEREAFERVESRLAWPAPKDARDAIDDIEHDLAVLGPLLRQQDAPEPSGRARYLMDLEPALGRSLRTRWARWTQRGWSHHDGIHPAPAIVHTAAVGGRDPGSDHDGIHPPQTGARAALDAHRLTARPYSVTALQRFAVCPYQFLLAAVHRLQPREEIAPLERLDPLTRGRMFHEAQAETVRQLEARRRLPVTREHLAEAWAHLDQTLDDLAARYREDLAPAIDRVWTDEIEKLRVDLKGWLQQVADEGGEWAPIRAELGFGFAPGPGRDPRSAAEPVRLDGGWLLHGVVDLVEARARPTAAGELRVTDHKTGRNRTAAGMVVGRGEVLQPVLYGLAVEQVLGRPVAESRLFFSTLAGGFGVRPVPLDDAARRYGAEVLSIIDRAIEEGVILPAPRKDACKWCDYRVVCGPWEETRVRRKDDTKLVDLQALRRLR